MVNTHPFVQAVFNIKGKVACVILYTKEQIIDLVRSCCGNVGDKSILGTTTVFKQHFVVRKGSEDNPIFFGPIYVSSW